MRELSAMLSLVVFVFVFCVLTVPANAQNNIQQTYQNNCAVCHNTQAQGNQLLQAPHLAGQEVTYLERQLNNFKIGARGYHPQDVNGRTMQPMAATLSDQQIKEMALYLNSLQPAEIPRTVTGSAVAGKEVYATCAACHGEQAKGNVILNSPNLVSLNDWYIENQIYKYKEGMRGNSPLDLIGLTMPPMVSLLNDQQIKDVVSYIYSLRYEQPAE